MSRKSCLALILLLATALCAFAQQPALKLVPYPKEVKTLESSAFPLSATTRIVIANAEDRIAAEMVAEDVQRVTGSKPRIVAGRSAANAIYLTRTSDAAAKSLAGSKKLDDEAYVIRASKTGVVVAGPTAAGTFYGAQTLRQLIGIDGKKSVPAVEIRDWPTMQWRGIHDDMSRGPIPTLDYIKKQIRTIAEYKMNLYSLYLEHVFDYKSVPLAAPKEAAITPAQAKELVEYAKKYHVTLIPEQQAFGHLHHVLKYELYNDLAEMPHGHVLAPVNPKSYDFIKNMYSELVPLFPGPLFHIGADETFELGRGQTAELAGKDGLGKIYLEHLRKVTEIMKPYNKRLMFWGDIAMHYPELLNILPKDVVAVPWSYGPSDNFDNKLKPYKDAGLDIVVSPGANNWNVIVPNYTNAFINIRNFVRDGQKYNALGMMNTTWDDDGEALFSYTWPAIVFGGAAAWQQGESSIEQFSNAYDWAFYRNADTTFRDAIVNLDKSHQLMKSVQLGQATDAAFWLDPFTEVGSTMARRALPIARDLRLSSEQAIVSLEQNRDKAKLHADTIDTLIMGGYRLDLLGMKIQFASEINGYYWDSFQNQSDRSRVSRNLHEITATNARLEDLRDQTTRVRNMYADAWKAEARPYWLENVLVRYDALALTYQQKIAQMQQARTQFTATGALPHPQQVGMYLPPEPATNTNRRAVGR